ncbi:MAG: hypothetical protein HZA89_10610 [Verrucomicrobia bacterium]|nr:hypothetical protein [Verrucomicrobiota bacterium]
MIRAERQKRRKIKQAPASTQFHGQSLPLRHAKKSEGSPYLIDRGSWQRSLAVSASGDNDPKRPRASRWRIALPHAGLPVTKLTCDTANPIFRRDASLVEEIANERGEKFRVTIGLAQWVRTPEQKAAKLSIAFSQPPRTGHFWLEVENGDNPPLALVGFTVWHPAPRVLFQASGTAGLELYYGQPQTAPPRYDLDLVARQMFSAEKARATLATEERLKKSDLGEALPAGKISGIFWAVLALVTVGLLVVLARLLPKASPPQ